MLDRLRNWLKGERQQALTEVEKMVGEVGRELLSEVVSSSDPELEQNQTEDSTANIPLESSQPIDLNPTKNSEEYWIQQSIQASAESNPQQALIAAEHAIEVAPQSPRAWALQGAVAGKFQKYEKALLSFDRAIEFNPNFDANWFGRGIALECLGQYEEAFASYDYALSLNPNQHIIWNQRGKTLRELGRYEEALINYEHALSLNPNSHKTWEYQGGALRDLARYEEAIASYDRALSLNPNESITWVSKGACLNTWGVLQSRYEEAMQCAQRGIDLQRDNAHAWYVKGFSLYSLDKDEEAIAVLNHSISLIKEDSIDYGSTAYSVGKAHYQFKRLSPNATFHLNLAVQAYQLALKIYTAKQFSAKRLDVLKDLIKAYLGLGDLQSAKQARMEGLHIFQDLINQADSSQRAKIEAKFSYFSRVEVDVLIQDGQLVTALETAERYKNRRLTRILNQWQEQVISPSYAEMRQLLNPTTAVIYWHFSDDSFSTLILSPTQTDPILVEWH